MTNDGLIRGNYFAEGEYVETSPRTGVMKNRAGTRMIALSDDFLRGLHATLENECGPAADDVFKTCGKTWGRKFAARVERELSEYHGLPMRDESIAWFAGCLESAFSHHGFGRLTLDLDRADRGILIADVRHVPFAELVGKSERPADPMVCGVVAGVFTHLAGRDLDAVQTRCPVRGDDRATFVVSLPERLQAVRDQLGPAATHDEFVRQLEQVRV